MTNKIKVLHLGSPSGLYGAERWIISLLKYLDPNKVESSVGVVNDDNYTVIPLCDEAQRLDIPTFIVNARGRVSLSAIRELRAIIRNGEFDIVHTHFYKTDLLGILAAIGTRCKVISTPHGWTDNPTLRLRLYELLSRIAYPFLDAVVPLSENILKPLRRIPGLGSKLFLIRNGVDIAEAEGQIMVAEEITRIREGGRFVLGYIGRLTPGKGLDVLLKTIAHHSEPSWHVALVGEGEQLGELKMISESLGIADRVHFFGFRADRLAFLKGFDVFVLPSRSEGIPRCLMESMAAGIPVVATDIPGCRHLIDGQTTGLLFPVDDSEALGNCVRRLTRADALRDELAQNGKAFLDQHYSVSRMAHEYQALYNTLASQRTES